MAESFTVREPTPFEIFSERAEVCLHKNPHYRKVAKPRPVRQFIPIPTDWWYLYGHTWELDVVEVTIKASVPNNTICVPVSDPLPISAYLMDSPPVSSAFKLKTYEFEVVAWRDVLTAFQYQQQLMLNFEEMKAEFWRRAEPFINDKTRVTIR